MHAVDTGYTLWERQISAERNKVLNEVCPNGGTFEGNIITCYAAGGKDGN